MKRDILRHNLEFFTPAWFYTVVKEDGFGALREQDQMLRHDFNAEFGPAALKNLSGKELRAERYRLIKKYMKSRYNMDI